MKWLAMLGVVLVAAGCGPDCLSTCQRIHGEGVDLDGTEQCNIQIPGKDRSELIRECTSSCEHAIARVGSLEGYDPNQRTTQAESQALANDAQAAVWMDCVEVTACEDLNSGYCAPTSNYSNN
jgi:hypothetical protein